LMSNGVNRRMIIQRAVHEELISLLDPGVEPFKPERGRQNVVMFVGLQGAGKTTTVTKYAYHYKRKGWRPALVCADTFRAGAYDQLEQNALRCNIPFYGDPEGTDPVKIAIEGVKTFKEAGMQLIIVDTSGRNMQEEGLFREMEEIRREINPDVVVLVMDGAMGQSAMEHAEAFKKSVDIGGIIITKLDDRNTKGGAALSAVVMTQSPIMFLGTGEFMDDFDEFDPKAFASQLLGIANFHKMFEFVKENVKEGPTQEEIKRIQSGNFTFRDFQKQMESVKDMPISKFAGMMGLGNLLTEEDGKDKIKNMMVILDSMTNKELDDPSYLLDSKTKKSRIERIARGAGRSIAEVNELLTAFRQLKGGFKQFTNQSRGSLTSKMGKLQRTMNSMGQSFDMKGIQGLMKQFGGGDG